MDVVGAVHFPSDANVTPERLVYALQRRAGERGARFLWNTAVTGFRVENRALRALTTATGDDVEADEFVLGAGAWSQQLAQTLRLKLPMQAGKGYSVTLPEPRVQPRHCAILVEARVFVSPMGEALRIGGTMEMAGLDESVNPIRVRAIVDAMTRYYPDFKAADFANLEPWRGLRPCSPDGLPFIGRTSQASNLVIAAGHAMMGVSLAPITGKLVAQTLCGEPPDIDLSLLSPDRYN
jgi:D-amino-acid dehydrogenase